jgi:hypothetical protein
MYVIKESLLDEQVVCWNCEEMVHESALQCPYCSVELRKHELQKATLSTPKITPIEQYTTTQCAPKPHREQQRSGSMVSFVFSLSFFLGGSAFLFLAAMIFFFSQEGVFAICWPKHNAFAFLGLGMAALSFGTLFLQNVQGPPDA